MKDFIGQELVEGDYISGISPDDKRVHLFMVTGMTPKKLRLQSLTDPLRTAQKYPHNVVKLDAAVVAKLSIPEPVDALGQKLAIGDTVFASGGEYIDPLILKIDGFLWRAATVSKVLGDHHFYAPTTRYLTDLIKVDSALITMHCLTKENIDV